MRSTWLLGSALMALTVNSLAQDLTESMRASYRRPDKTPFPASNPYTPQKAALGKMLFFDTRLSRDQNLNCASCHNPSFGWEVPFSTAIGAGGKPLGRHAPTALNHAWTPSLFWDGRAPSLEAQARGPIEAPAEMGLPLATAVTRLQAVVGYRTAFDKVFPGEGVTEENILKSIATFERTVVSGDTPFDRWIRGEASAMPESARRGFALFTGKAGCASCHSGWNFTDNKFHDIGLTTRDDGRKNVTGKEADLHAFRTPSLREIVARAPYMHHGQLPSLDAVLNHYISGGEPRQSRAPQMRPIALNPQEKQDLIDFMRCLSSPQSAASLPHLPS
ncbi:MAG: hypothetical protein RLZZ592_909 [Pseudomonadota bacterium]|jgi:cytochrome c peroxidase